MWKSQAVAIASLALALVSIPAEGSVSSSLHQLREEASFQQDTISTGWRRNVQEGKKEKKGKEEKKGNSNKKQTKPKKAAKSKDGADTSLDTDDSKETDDDNQGSLGTTKPPKEWTIVNDSSDSGPPDSEKFNPLLLGFACIDVTGWVDSYGDSCAWYAADADSGCSQADSWAVDGVSAKQACCACGGAMRRVQWVPSKVFDGECLGEEVQMFEGGANDGTNAEKLARCSQACLNDPSNPAGFVIRFSDGACACEVQDSSSCTRVDDRGYSRYNWDLPENVLVPVNLGKFECNGIERLLFQGLNGDNQGTTDEQVHRCSQACLKEPWPEEQPLGFIVRPDGRCWCEFQDSATCERNSWDHSPLGFSRYDWKLPEEIETPSCNPLPDTLVPYKVFDGECNGEENLMFVGFNGDNPGTPAQKLEACSQKCLQHCWEGGQQPRGFILRTDGRCWCEFQDSQTCDRSTNFNEDGYDRYDWGFSQDVNDPMPVIPGVNFDDLEDIDALVATASVSELVSMKTRASNGYKTLKKFYVDQFTSCYRDSYAVGSSVADCPEGYTNNGPSCGRGAHSYWPDGHLGRAADCPSGYTNTGVSCFRGVSTYGKCCCSIFTPSCCSTCQPGYTDNGCTCGRGAHTLGLSSASCKPGEFKSGAFCYPECLPGYTQTAILGCHRPVDTLWGFDSMTCPSGREKRGSRCYPPCENGYTSDGLEFCWATCPEGFTNCGLFCHSEGEAGCVGGVMDMIVSVGVVTANIVAKVMSGGTSTAVQQAAAVPQRAARFAKLAKLLSQVKKYVDTIKKTAKAIKIASRTYTIADNIVVEAERDLQEAEALAAVILTGSTTMNVLAMADDSGITTMVEQFLKPECQDLENDWLIYAMLNGAQNGLFAGLLSLG